MDLGLKGKSVVVTGGSKGIGFAAAEAFLKEEERKSRLPSVPATKRN